MLTGGVGDVDVSVLVSVVAVVVVPVGEVVVPVGEVVVPVGVVTVSVGVVVVPGVVSVAVVLGVVTVPVAPVVVVSVGVELVVAVEVVVVGVVDVPAVGDDGLDDGPPVPRPAPPEEFRPAPVVPSGVFCSFVSGGLTTCLGGVLVKPTWLLGSLVAGALFVAWLA